MSLRERTLDETQFFQRHQLVQIEAERSKYHFHPSLGIPLLQQVQNQYHGNILVFSKKFNY